MPTTQSAPNPPSDTLGPFGIVWSNASEEIAQTGYVYDTVDEAISVGEGGLVCFTLGKTDEEMVERLGTQVDWTARDTDAKPLGFYVDEESGNYLHWVEASG